jgi:hypothetical protein
MESMREYKKFWADRRSWRAHEFISTTWIKIHTGSHREGVTVWWNPECNLLSCFSQSWPHDGWQEYIQDDGSTKFVFEHEPWRAPQHPWIYIGDL